MAAAATYRIGPSDFFTPGDLQADANTLDGQIKMLDASIDGNQQIPQDQWDQFNVWESDWRKFYTDHFASWFDSFGSALNDGNRDQLLAFENNFQSWVDTFSKSGVAPAGPVIQPSSGTKDNIGDQLKHQLGIDLSSVTWLVVAVIALVVVWHVVKS